MNEPSEHRYRVRRGLPARAVSLALLVAGFCLAGRAQVFFTENFTTDGEGSRYVSQGRGVFPGLPTTGPAYWARNVDVTAIGKVVGVPAPAPARRAVLVYNHNITWGTVTDDGWKLIDATIKWLTDGKPKLNVLFSAAANFGDGDQMLVQRLTEQGHIVVDDDGGTLQTPEGLPDPATIDLVINGSSAGEPARLVRYAVPILSYRAAISGDLLLATRGETLTFDPGTIKIEAPSHPIAAGLPATFNYLTEEQPLDTVGLGLPADATTIASYQFTNADGVVSTRPLLAVIEKGVQMLGGLLTGFDGPFWTGADLNEPEISAGTHGTPSDPRTLTLNPVSLSGRSNVKLTIALAGTDVDFDFGADDFFRIMIDTDGAGPAEFAPLATFASPSGSEKFYTDGTTRLGIVAKDVTYDIPAGATDLVIRFESNSTFWNEIVAFDNIRLSSGAIPPPPPPGIPVAANLSVGPAKTAPGDGLYGEYWQRGVNTIKTDGNTVPANRIDTQIAGFGTPTGTFTAKVLSYTGNDLTAMPGWLAADSASFAGKGGNLDDGAFRFTGFLNIAAPGTLNIGTTSDDGSRIKIAGIDIIDNDGGHGDATVDKTVSFAAAGVYPIEITYFNGDWTSDGEGANLNHSGNPDPSVHGGANFHLRIAGANITPAQVGTYLHTVPGPNYVHQRHSAGTPLTIPGDGLNGEYWQRPVNSIKTDGNTVAENRIDAQIAGFGPPSGTFTAKVLSYTGNDLTAMPGWLAGDSASYSGAAGNLDDGAFRFRGFINVPAAGKLNIGTTSDDGSRIKVAGVDIINNDGGHGDATVDADVNFAAAGVYPIEITYFNGDWTSDGEGANLNHSGNPDPSVHGGANFHLRLNGANITADGAQRLFRTADGKPPVPAKKIAWVSFHGTNDDAPTTAAAAAGFTKAPDVGYTDLLKANGYSVTRFLSRDDADLTALNDADLVIISRSVASGHYQQANETAAWNGLKKPVIIMGGYIARNSRLGFTTGGTIPDTAAATRLTVSNPAHPVFAGVALGAGNVMVNPYADIVTFAGAAQRGISVNTDALPAGGTVLAVDAAVGGANGGMIVGEWPAGATLANTPPSTLGGPRLVFLSGSREQGITSEGAGIYDLAADGAKLFLNAVTYMLGKGASGSPTFKSATVSGTNLTIEWTGGGTLERSDSVTGPWTAVAGATSPHTTPISGTGGFFRLR